jgi:hypothetical protein
MKDLIKQWPHLVLASIVCVLLMVLYAYVLTINDIIPLAGKKAPSYIIVLLAQVYLVRKWVGVNRGVSVHFLKLFLFQYIFVFLTAVLGTLVLYYFYQSATGLEVLQDYIRLSVQELGKYKDVIINQEGKEFNMIEKLHLVVC